ncbi:MAG: hypothetical protein KDJ41_17385 [Hyphomicrobiaceae bacterium]|nr:hypothetical protein [Hyphomicrobiaceae bacterium]
MTLPNHVRRLFVAAALAWVLFVGYRAWQGWPHVPLDMSPNDPQTRAALAAAVRAHVLWSAALALVPAGLLLVVTRMTRQRDGKR